MLLVRGCTTAPPERNDSVEAHGRDPTMSDTSRPTLRNTRALLQVGAVCAVLWLAIVTIFRAEEGLGADITWLVSTIIVVVGLVAFLLAGAAAIRNRR